MMRFCTPFIALCICVRVFPFQVFTRHLQVRYTNGLSMEYIPDGLTKAQWEAVKKKVH
jgi:hypothetical protein